ncbi:MAG: hypothetical protein AVO35_05325 [Candidatus Aegiribacteria sp. MLS_C]|nr:MAG: hypothetical protein AVO35_05325 [Candidatus Aegiribacteria sp. MLS_C]
MRRIRFLAGALLLFLCSGGVSGELMRLVREPTAGIVAPGTYHFSMNTFPSDGLRFSLTAGIFSRFAAGLGYGGWNVIGMDRASWFDHLYIKARFRLIDETGSFPGVLLGFDNEPEAPRSGATYSREARDLYLVFSKNFNSIGGDMAFHFGLSADVRRLVHAGVWTGMDKSLPGGFGLVLEYDFATDEDDSVRFDNNGGFLSGEVYWESFGQVRISLQFIDIFETGGESYRALGVDFLGLL